MSPPAQKALSPAPCNTIAYTSGSAEQRSRRSRSSRIMASDSALSALGRFRVMNAMWLRISLKTSMEPLNSRVLEQIDDRREVLRAESPVAPRPIELLGRRVQYHALFRMLRRLHREPQVLEHEISREAASVAARSRHVLHDAGVGVVGVAAPATPARAIDHPRQHFCIETEREPGVQGFGDSDHADPEQHVVADLGRLAVAHGTAMHDVLAHNKQQRLYAFEQTERRAHHEGQGACLSAGGAARYGGGRHGIAVLF